MSSKILFIPIDDRPCTYKMPVKIAKIAGFDSVSPPVEYLGKYKNAGNCDGIIDWLENVEENFQASVICLDMPLCGGLVASRKSGAFIDEVKRRLNRFVDILKSKRDKFGKLYLFKTIQRIAPTYSDESLIPIANAIIEYNKCIYEEFKNGSSKNLESARSRIPDDIFEEYVKARRQNHEINKLLPEKTKELNAEFLLFGLDDCLTTGFNIIEKDEIEKIIDEKDLSGKILIIPGTDEAASILMARALSDITGIKASVFPVFSNPSGKDVIPIYENISFKEIIMFHTEACGMKIADSKDDADIIFFAHAPKSRQTEAASQGINFKRSGCNGNFIDEINNVINSHKRACIADLFYANGADIAFMRKIAGRVNLTNLAGFAAWNTAGNSIGTALAHSAIFNIAEKTINPNDFLDPAFHHVSLIIERFCDDWLYQAVVRQQASIEAKLKGASIFHLDNMADYFNSYVSKRMEEKIKKFYKECIEGFKLKIGDGVHFTPGCIKSLKINLPWDRLFEVDIEINFPVSSSLPFHKDQTCEGCRLSLQKSLQ